MPNKKSGLKELFDYPLLSAILHRRSRRVAQGTSIHSGAMSHESTNAPAPLRPLEEAILIASTGLTAITTHDGPLDYKDDGKELATPFMNILGRAASSPDNSQPTRIFMTNDDGTWLIRRLEGKEGLDLLKDLPARWEDWAEADWLHVADTAKHRISDRRLDFPRKFPYYMGWNRQISNVPGTTMFLPIVDTTRMYINGILNVLASPDGERPLFIDDWQHFHPRNIKDWAAWAADHLGLIPDIPYQPIGGVDRVKGGFVNPKIMFPLGLARTMLSDHEAYFIQQNLMLVSQALGLGSWVHACAQAPYIFQRDDEKGLHGLGFRMETPKKEWTCWPPLPSTQPNPVGINGVLEGLCPPYVTSMDEAVDRHLEDKRAAYADTAIFSRSYRDAGDVERFRASGMQYSPETIEYTKEICNYIFDTYGRFPAHTDAFYAPGTWVQVCHIELEYYEKYFNPALYRRQSEHASKWSE